MTPQTYTLSDSDLISIDLHLHRTQHAGGSLLLSRDGIRGHAFHIPKSLLEMPGAVIATRINGELSQKGRFRVARWKLKTLGWLSSNDDARQGSFDLAHGKTASEQGGSSA